VEEEVPVLETEEQKKQKEIVVVKQQIDASKQKCAQYEEKLQLCISEKERQDGEEKRKKTTDLVEKASQDRKFLKGGSREYADTVLGPKRCYNFVELKHAPEEQGDDQILPITINGKAIRTPDEDIKWEEEQKELEANAPKGGKAAAKGKKK
jgi:hypothetical protein